MSVRSGQSITVQFTTRVFSTGVGTNADSLPTGTLYLNGTANGATVTVTNISTGLYKAAVTLPTLAIGDEVQIIIAATVSSISDSAVIWGDTKDVLLDSSGDVTFNNTSIATVTTVTNQVTANVTNINSVSCGSVTTINANQGTTQPVNFSGTGSSAYVKGDTEQLNAQAVSASGTVTFPAATVASTTNITAGTITTVGTLTTYTGNTPQTGDAYARLGAPAGSSVSADIAAVKSDTGTIKTATNTGVAPGANGGLMISGANAGPWTVSGGTTLSGGVIFQNTSGTGFIAQCTSGNGAGAQFLGHGTGDGADFWSGTGATGKGMYCLSQASNDYGLYCISAGTDATYGIYGSINGTITTVTGNVNGSVGSVTGAVGSVTGNVGGHVAGYVGSIQNVSFPTNFGAMLIGSGGNVGIDWANVANQGAVVDLSETSIYGLGSDVTFSPTPENIAVDIFNASIVTPFSTTTIKFDAATMLATAGMTVVIFDNNNLQYARTMKSVTQGSGSFTIVLDWPLPSTPTSAWEVGYTLATNNGVVDSNGYVTYNNAAPPTAAQNATAVWTDTTASDFTQAHSPGVMIANVGGSGTVQFTTGALANAPGGSGSDPWATALPASYTAGQAGYILGKQFEGMLTSTTGIGVFTSQALANAPTGSGGGSGAYAVSVVVTSDGSTPIVGALCRVSGAQSAFLASNNSGIAAFSLNAGTVTLSVTAPGYYYNATVQTINSSGDWASSGSATLTLTMTANPVITPSPNPALTNCYFTCFNSEGSTVSGAVFKFSLIDPRATTNAWSILPAQTATSSSSGIVTIELPINQQWQITGPDGGRMDFFTGPGPTTAMPPYMGSF